MNNNINLYNFISNVVLMHKIEFGNDVIVDEDENFVNIYRLINSNGNVNKIKLACIKKFTWNDEYYVESYFISRRIHLDNLIFNINNILDLNI